MKKFKTKWFKRWVAKNLITLEQLEDAVSRIEQEQSVANLGGNIYKVRIAKTGKGKSGGYRTILIYKKETIALFIYGFEKNDMENIDAGTLEDYKKYAKAFLQFTEKELNVLINNGSIFPLEDL